MLYLRQKLEDNYHLTGDPILRRESEQADAIFKNMSEIEFIKQLNASTGNPDVMYTSTYFTFKKAYPFNNKKELHKYLLEHGQTGIEDDFMLHVVYKGIKRDI